MTFYSSQSVFDRLAAAETESSFRKRNQSDDEKVAADNHHSNNTPFSTYYSARSASNTPRSSRSGTVSSSLFNRLANTETYATASMKGKIPSPPHRSHERSRTSKGPHTSDSSDNDGFWHRLAYTETFSTAQLKGMNDQDAHTPNTKKKTSDSFFHRMAYSETFATASKKGLVEDSPKQKDRNSPQRKTRTSNDFFDRMSRTDTYATASMKAVFDYGKSPGTPSMRKKNYISPDVFERLSRTDTKSSSLKKSSSWQKREEVQSRYTPRISITVAARKKYLTSTRMPRTRTPDELASVASARSSKSLRSERSIKSNIADYASPRGHNTFMSRLANIDSKPNRSSSQNKPMKSTTFSVRSTASSTRRGAKSSTNSISSRNSITSAQRSTAAERLRQEATKKNNRNRPTSPAITSTTGSLSSLQSSRREVASISSRSAAIQSRKMEVAPKAAQKPKPPPRPVLQFDSDDDFSYGESEDEDDFDLGGKSDKEEEKKELSAATRTAPQDILTQSNDKNKEPTGRGLLNEDEEKVDAQTIEIVLDKPKQEVTLEESVLDDNEYGDAMSVETASIDDILGEPEEKVQPESDTVDHESNEIFEKEPKSEPDQNEIKERDLIDFSDHDNNDEMMEEPIVGKEEPKEKDENDTANIMNDYAEKPENETYDNPAVTPMKQDDELDVILDDPQPQEVDDDLDDILDGPQENEDAPKEQEEKTTPPTFGPLEDDDDFSYGDESLDEEEFTHKDNEEEKKSEEKIQEELPQQVEENHVDEPPQSQEYKEGLNDVANNADIENPPKQDMKKSDTIDSLDFLLDASSTIAEELEEDQEYPNDDAEEEIPNEDHEVMDHPYDDDSLIEDGSLMESIIEEGDEGEEEEEMEEPEKEIVEETHDDEPGMEEEDAGDDLPPLRYKLLISDKYHPEYGLEELYPDELDLVDSLTAFEEGAISNQEMAVLIIEALFERDFEDGDHWEIDHGTARDLEEDEGGGGDLAGCAFVVKRQARLDWNDLYSVAAAKGTIIVSSQKDEIKVENYSYFVAG